MAFPVTRRKLTLLIWRMDAMVSVQSLAAAFAPYMDGPGSLV